MSSYSQSYRTTNDNGYIWDGSTCNCCPYGYHIDLDFVRYCETISQEADRTGSIKRRKDRRRQRQSMEVLLGITPPVLAALEQSYKTIQEQETPKIIQTSSQLPVSQDAFDDAISDFERTLQRSKNKLYNNLPDVTAVSETIKRVPSNSSMSSVSGSSMTVLPETTNRDFDTVSIESCGLSPLALQSIREQMAISLERTKLLEDQVKLIPQLKEQLSSLKEENRRLHLQLKSEETQKYNTINANYLRQSPQNNRMKSQSFTNIDSLDSKEAPPPPPRKDFGVNCGVLTRNIGVGHQNPNTKTVSTATLDDLTVDKWFNEKIKFMNSQNISRSSQTLIKEIRGVASQTIEKPPMIEAQTQTAEPKKYYSHASVSAIPKIRDFSVQKCVEVYNIGTSDDTISDIVCEKCSVCKCSVGVGPDSSEDSHTSPVSLASLMGPRSKSFNLGEAPLNFNSRSRTVACQYENFGVSKASQFEPAGVSRACQCEVKTHSKACQHELKQIHKNTQYESNSVSKDTDTKDLITAIRHVACEAKERKKLTTDVGCNTCDDKTVCAKCTNKEKEEVNKKDTSFTSKIPRPQIPTTPVENRKFRRQDTYTKIYSSPGSPTLGLSGLDLSPKSPSNELSNPIDKLTHNFKLPEKSHAQNGVAAPTKVQIQESTLPLPETALFNPASAQHRKKAVPSKEMQGAMKVLNDSLQKSQTKNLKSHNAINIVQQEWFKISSLYTANPLDVEDYLDAFEEVSSVLLQYIVNMTDESGNTAMHYAVSHGNFDVVSILLDSKVCDINKPNKAGYTSVMLVSLAEVRSQTHANVVRRLFQLADVNIRAKQHGQTALMLAVSHGRLDMVKMLLEAGADINIQDEDGSTALMCAAEHGHDEIVKHFLTQPDCDSSITDIDGSTALKIAMEAGHRHIGVLLYAHQRRLYGKKKSKPASPKTPLSPLPIRSSHRALTDTKTTK
ncbi:KN motif and ankyrin repeat domain-containing protein 2-like [Tribolium madens]|uniref:KN motif and ankyrin repeat domain-containing protein 2-like n=1 Tax=Tribolium madens TaxID=41895 RepID=UPI001CF74CC7|nr:KN motif and ankyrin repeat domain-containing protein 2-like [Tribolium madens]XP_044256923.1 KN motif and ankyrin repeat domain-containing protein 2-like [Tribolium madens]